jgi:hypothetical protein
MDSLFPLTRRRLLGAALAGAAAPPAAAADPIDRRALVARHDPVIRDFDPLTPLSVGNGNFAFSVDPTGLQTFPEPYEKGTPLCTQSSWGWHSFPLPAGLNPGQFHLREYDTHGRKVGYPTSADGQKELFNWLRENPHRMNLGRIGLRLRRKGDISAVPADLHDVELRLDLFSGTLHSRFQFEGSPVEVETCCHPRMDLLAVRVSSPLLGSGHAEVLFSFPYGSPEVNASDWANPARHSTADSARKGSRVDLRRTLDETRYAASVEWQGEAAWRRESEHTFALSTKAATLQFVCAFSQATATSRLPDAAAVFRAAGEHWRGFWDKGGAIDFDGSTDPIARELERRAVLSQYLTAIQCCGPEPPQETGLTCNSWYGKFHLEMHWWHAVHFALWNRYSLLDRSLDWYAKILPAARATARQQGYAGARWPKMTDPSGRESPSPIGPLLIWQQPHPIYYAELAWQARGGPKTLARFREVVFESAEFLASYAWRESAGGRYVLGPPLIPAQENHPPEETWNPPFELEYCRFALEIANQWRRRLGLQPDPKWAEVIRLLSPLPQKDGVYLAHENCPQTYTGRNRDHPSMLAALGMLPGRMADRDTMRRTLEKVMREWRWPDTWGWDYPMAAMTAARLDLPNLAVDALLLDTPKNRYLANGHNWQRPNLPLYLPGNGGLLAALAHMCAGAQRPVFPDRWKVRWERLEPLL